jgi:L-fuculose-phosphate aldolase
MGADGTARRYRYHAARRDSIAAKRAAHHHAAAESGVGHSKLRAGKMAKKTNKAHLDIKQQMVMAGKVLVAEGHDDFTRGHISMRLPDNPKLFFMKPHSVGLDEITVQNILTIDLEGNVVAGKARRHSEVYIHSEILKARPDLNCVIHTHSPYAVALSGTGRPMRAYSQPGALFCGEMGLYTDAIALIRSHAMGAAVAKALGRHRAVLLKNHGPVMTGKTIAEAVVAATMLENAAMIQLAVEAAGDAAPEFPADDLAKLKSQISQPEQFQINFDYLVRRVKLRGR